MWRVAIEAENAWAMLDGRNSDAMRALSVMAELVRLLSWSTRDTGALPDPTAITRRPRR